MVRTYHQGFKATAIDQFAPCSCLSDALYPKHNGMGYITGGRLRHCRQIQDLSKGFKFRRNRWWLAQLKPVTQLGLADAGNLSIADQP